MDKRKNNGGARANSGRAKKIDEITLIESMDAIAVPDVIWNALCKKAKEGDSNAIKTWLQYRFGMPKQTIDSNVSLTDFSIKEVLEFDNLKQ